MLRGPQGTLFGRNASAGLIHVITRRPEFQFGGMAELTYGNYDYIRGQIGITGPITSQLAGRLDAVYTQRDGFYRVVNPTGGTESRVNDRDRLFVRGQLLFEPSDALSIRLIGDYTRREESCCGAVYTETRETFDPTPGVPGDFAYQQPGAGGSPSGNRIVDILASLGGVLPSNGDPYNRLISVSPGRSFQGDTRDWGVSAQVDWDLGGARLTSITAFRNYRSEQPGDVDYNNVDILYRADDGNAFRRFETFTQELRLQGQAFGGRLDWLVGAYFASEDLQVRDNLRFGTQYGAFAACRLVATVSPNPALRNPALPGCLSAAGRATLVAPTVFGPIAGAVMLNGLDRLSTVNDLGDNTSNYFQESRNWAIFTHNIFNITDQLSLTLGLRYTSENKDFSATFNNNNTICPTQQAFFSNFLPAGATPFPNVGQNGFPATSAQAFAQGIVNLTCQGNSSSSLNALNLTDERDEDEFTGTGVLSFRPNNRVLLYASYSHGYKAGGFNLDRSALGSPVFAPGDPRNRGGRGALFGTDNLESTPRRWTPSSSASNIRPQLAGERRRLPSAVQQLPAEHVQRLGLPRPEHQRLQRRPGRFDDQRHRHARRSGRLLQHRRLRGRRRVARRADHRHRGRGADQSGAAPDDHRRRHLGEHPLSRRPGRARYRRAARSGPVPAAG